MDAETRRELADGRYRLERQLGTGATASVWQAWDTVLDVPRAIKLLKVDGPGRKTLRRRLKAEARAMARLAHPNILRIIDIGIEDEQDYVVMELAPGGSLQDVLDRGGPMAPGDAIRYTVQVLSALAAAHSAGIVHRDVKPQNILLDEKGTTLLADFGIALLAEDHRTTRTGVAMGSLAFMAPEQRLDARSVGPAADIYAVTTTLYNLVTGANPIDLFAAEPDSDRWSDLHPELVEILQRGAKYYPDDRFRDAKAMAARLVAAMKVIGDAPARNFDPNDPAHFPMPSKAFTEDAITRQTQGTATPATPTATPNVEAVNAAITFLEDDFDPFVPIHVEDQGKAPEDVPDSPTLVAELGRPESPTDVRAVVAADTLADPVQPTPKTTDATVLLPDVDTDLPPTTVAPRRSPLLLLGAFLAGGAVLISAGVGVVFMATAFVATAPEPTPEPLPKSKEKSKQKPPDAAKVKAKDKAKSKPKLKGKTKTKTKTKTKRTVVAPSPDPKPAPAPALPPPLGSWRGSFGGRVVDFHLGGTPDAIAGRTVVHLGSNSVKTRVSGSFNPTTRKLTLSDQSTASDAGQYDATLTKSLDSMSGTWKSYQGGRTLQFSASRR